MRILASSLLATSLLAVPALALADSSAAPAPTPFAIMDNTGDGSKLQADFAFTVLDEADGSLSRTNLLGQYIHQTSFGGIGGYAGIAASTVFFGDDVYDSLGGLQLGALYQTRISDLARIGFRLGAVVPTADGGEGSLVHAATTIVARPADVVTFNPDTTWLRVGVSPTLDTGAFFARVDLGLDVPVLDGDDADLIGHANLGLGMRSGPVTLTAELQNAFSFDSDTSEQFIHTAAVAAHFDAGRVKPFVALSSPLDDGARGEVVMATVGLTANL